MKRVEGRTLRWSFDFVCRDIEAVYQHGELVAIGLSDGSEDLFHQEELGVFISAYWMKSKAVVFCV